MHTQKHIKILSFKMLSASRRRNFVKLTKPAIKSIEILYIYKTEALNIAEFYLD